MPGEKEATELNEIHASLVGEAAEFASQSVAKAIDLGKKLRAIKKTLGHGHWQQWVEKYLTFSVTTAKRYMSLAKPKRSSVIVLRDCATLMAAYSAAGISLKGTNGKTAALKLFTPAATKVLSQPTDSIPPEQKEIILREYVRLEPIAHQLCERPTIFAMIWQKKLEEPPVRWTRKEIELFRAEVEKAKKKLAEIEADIELAEEITVQATEDVEVSAEVQGDAP